MPDVFHHYHVVTPEEIDPLGHANNIVYLDWMQSAAIAHSTAQGWPMERYRERGWSWVVRTHHIEYRRPAFVGDEIIVCTWVATMEKFSSARRFEIRRRGGKAELLAKAETHWAFVDLTTARLMPVPPDVRQAFVLVTSPPQIPPAENVP